jgi:uncharacterized protein (TIGR02679 family)
MAERAEGFGRPELTPLWTEARRRFEQGTVTTLRLRQLTPAQQQALADLLGLPRLPGADPTVTLDHLDAALRPVGLDTRSVVEAIGGPITDRAAQRSADRADRAALWQWLESHPVVAAQPALQGWIAGVRNAGLVGGSPATTRDLLGRALAVLAALPADGQSLATFADHVCGDTHALDDGTRLSGLVLRALAALQGEPPPEYAEGRRRMWESVGVACDALSTTVLVAGLRPTDDGPLATTMRCWADAGQSVCVTLAQLRATTMMTVPTETVRVVENPSVIAAAVDRLGARCPPMACVNGWPTTAAVLLLRRLVAAGCPLAYHGDLDGEGIRIAAYIIAKTGAAPWRMSTVDYLAAVPPGGASVGRVTDAPWDPDLAPAMRTHGIAVFEERVLDRLLNDLAPA